MEHSAGGDFSDAVVHLIEAQAAGALSRAFAAAEVQGSDWVKGAVYPAFLAQASRDLVRSGDSMNVIDVDPMGKVALLPCSSWHWKGNADPSTWTVLATVYGPSAGLGCQPSRPESSCNSGHHPSGRLRPRLGGVWVQPCDVRRQRRDQQMGSPKGVPPWNGASPGEAACHGAHREAGHPGGSQLSTTVAVGFLRHWSTLITAASSYGQRLFPQRNRPIAKVEITELAYVRL